MKMSTIAIPNIVNHRRQRVWILLPAIIIVSLGVVWLMNKGFAGGAAAASGQFHRVVPMDMDVKVVKTGELQAVNNIDISSQVEGQNTIQQIVKEGASVKKGDVLIVLDSASIKQKIEDTTLDLQKAQADLTAARELNEIQRSQNAANLQAATVELELAKLDLQQYTAGTYPQQLNDAKTTLEMAQITLKNREEDLSQTQKLFAKGFVTAADVKKAELEVLTARNTVTKSGTALDVLTKYAYQMDMAAKQSALAQAEQKLARTQKENASNLAQKVADVQAKDQSLAVLKRRYERYLDQLDKCTIEAPTDGMVIYGTSGDRSSQTPIQEGTTVRERQLLLRLPDTSTMKAVIRVQESQVAKLSPGQRAQVRIVGLKEPIGATLEKISVLADNSQRWLNPDLKEYPVDLVLDYTPANLKPGMGVDGEIFINRLSQVLAVPLPSIYSAGQDSYIFTRDGKGTRPVKVTLGAVNETHAQILAGVSEGHDVLVLQAGQGRELLEAAGITPTPLVKSKVLVDKPPGLPKDNAASPLAEGQNRPPSGEQNRKKDKRSKGD